MFFVKKQVHPKVLPKIKKLKIQLIYCSLPYYIYPNRHRTLERRRFDVVMMSNSTNNAVAISCAG